MATETSKTIPIIHGNILDAMTEYIVQQNCCTAMKPRGLSEAIAAKWPEIDPYSNKKKFKGNWSTLDSRPEPGTIWVYEQEKSPHVICMFAQYIHGKPGYYKDPLNAPFPDTAASRLTYFRMCIESITELKPKSIGFPWKIGRGLAGGDWTTYYSVILDWSKKNPEIYCVFYKLD